MSNSPSCKGSCFVLLRFSSKCLRDEAPIITASENTKKLNCFNFDYWRMSSFDLPAILQPVKWYITSLACSQVIYHGFVTRMSHGYQLKMCNEKGYPEKRVCDKWFTHLHVRRPSWSDGTSTGGTRQLNSLFLHRKCDLMLFSVCPVNQTKASSRNAWHICGIQTNRYIP